jgi:hypothetical protein
MVKKVARDIITCRRLFSYSTRFCSLCFRVRLLVRIVPFVEHVPPHTIHNKISFLESWSPPWLGLLACSLGNYYNECGQIYILVTMLPRQHPRQHAR